MTQGCGLGRVLQSMGILNHQLGWDAEGATKGGGVTQ